MKVGALYNPLTVVADTAESLRDAARRMERNDVGSLAVLDGPRLVGIITERDVTRAVADGDDLGTTSVGDRMTTVLEVADAAEEAHIAATRMLGVGVRHLPVVAEGKLLGMLSIRDVVEALTWDVAAPPTSVGSRRPHGAT